MIKADYYFKENLKKISNYGVFDEGPRPKYKDGLPAHSKYITQIFEEYNLEDGEFPITTLRNTSIKTGIKEIFWIYQKQSNLLSDARDLGINWWDSWDIGDGTIGHRYGYTVKKYNLLNNLLDGLKNDPFSRRHIMDMYQYTDLNETSGLYPCAFKTTWSVRKVNGDYLLDMTLDQRSSDFIVANFINKTQYVALQMMVASHLGFKLGKFCHFVQNLHIYERHIDAMNEILDKCPLDIQPSMELISKKKFYDFTISDFMISNISEITKIISPIELAI